MKTVYLTVLIFLSLFICIPSSHADIQYPEGEKYDPIVDLIDLGKSIKEGAWKRAAEIVYDSAKEYIKDLSNDPERMAKLIAGLLNELGDVITSIIEGPGTDEEKAAQIIALVEQDLIDIYSGAYGQLNLQAQYAPTFFTYKLSWDRVQKQETCQRAFVGYRSHRCGADRCWDDKYNWWVNFMSLYWEFEWQYERVDYYYEPLYRVYRVIDGVETLITTISGYQDSIDWMNPLEVFGELTGDGVDIPDDRLVFYDYDAPVYQGKDSTLAYKIVATTSVTKAPCADSETFVSTLLIDGDADGDPDFIPWHLLHKDIAAMVPIISLTLY